jgi:N-methylhydantoinase A/oxoprolinase/acetone carboxylase beta subunit
MLRIGIDVGGTNTDAVLMDGLSILDKYKARTTEDVMTGVINALDHLIGNDHQLGTRLQAVMIGTTQFTNALIERRHLAPVGALRLAAPATCAIRPTTDWPTDLIENLPVQTFIVSGGHEFDGHASSPISQDELMDCCKKLTSCQIEHVVITGMFSPLNSAHEIQAASYIQDKYKNLSVETSSRLGKLGLLERENAAILNASLKPLARKVIHAFQIALKHKKITCPLYLTQNDGTLMSADDAMRLPILTISSGPTNSMRGAAFLSGLTDAIVIDVGGTTTDVGILDMGLPRLSSVAINVAGVRTNFRMPDLYSMGLGGGTYIRQTEMGCSIGPDSSGFRIIDQALVFGGSCLTATDIAVAANRTEIGHVENLSQLKQDFVQACISAMDAQMEQAVDRVRTSGKCLPILAVGGGCVLLPNQLDGLEVVRPAHHDVANAVGAAMAQVSGESDQLMSLSEINRDEAIRLVIQKAKENAIQKGAFADSLVCHQVDEVPLSYIPGNMSRITVKVVGNLQAWGN